jgi:hypothetical protein
MNKLSQLDARISRLEKQAMKGGDYRTQWGNTRREHAYTIEVIRATYSSAPPKTSKLYPIYVQLKRRGWAVSGDESTLRIHPVLKFDTNFLLDQGRADPNRYGKILFDDHSWVLKEVEGARRALRRYAKLYDLELTDFFKRLGGRGTNYPRDLNLSGGIQSPVFTLYDPNFQDDLDY